MAPVRKAVWMSGWPPSQLCPMDRTSPEARRSERMEVNPNSAVCSAPLLIRGPIAPSNSFCELTLHSQVTLWIESRGHARGCPTEPRPELVRELCQCTVADGARRQADCGSGAAKRAVASLALSRGTRTLRSWCLHFAATARCCGGGCKMGAAAARISSRIPVCGG